MTRIRGGPTLPDPVRGWLVAPLEKFLRIESASGVVLLACAALAFAWANSPANAQFEALWNARVFSHALRDWINEGLMTLFFLVVGIEIRRELQDGALAGIRRAMLPLAAAFGGIVVPAVLYLAIGGDPGTRRGWAIPTATDIAFAVGVLTLLGSRVPIELRVLLLALAIVDDIVAIAVIALFYGERLDPLGTVLAATAIAGVVVLRQLVARAVWPYLLFGAALWAGLLAAGVHPTLAGVVLGFLAPVAAGARLEAALHGWVAFVVMPAFALANAGVSLNGIDWDAAGSVNVMLACLAGLAVGKPAGVLAGSWLAVRLGLCELPSGVNWRGVAVIAILSGIGFTMAIFIASLAFDGGLLAAAKVGVLAASGLAALLGLLAGWRLLDRPARPAK